MGIIKGFLIFVEVMVSVLLIGVILLQKAKDEGLGLAFGAGVGETLFGSRAGNVLSKITIGLAIVFLVNTMVIGLIVSGGRSGSTSITDSLPSTTGSAPMSQGAPEAGGAAMPAAPAPAGESVPLPTPQSAPLTAPVSVPAPAAP
jgi:preprotein translocase subunit SecG